MNPGALEIVLVGLAGSGVGIVSGLFGVGGGFLLVPVLHVGLRIPIEVAVGVGACQGLGPTTTALLARRISPAQTRFPLTIAGGLMVGVICGALLLDRAKQAGEIALPYSSKIVPTADLLVLSVYLFVLCSVGLFALWESFQPNRPEFLIPVLKVVRHIPPYAHFEDFERPRMSIPILAWFGLAVGFCSGLLGINGGLILLPGMIYLLGIRTHQAIMNSLVIVWLVALQSTIAHAWHEHVSLPLVLALLLGGTVGARFGAEFCGKLEGRTLRRRFGCLLLAAAALVAGRLGRILLG